VLSPHKTGKSHFRFYKTQRGHAALDKQTPDEVYFGISSLPMAA